MLTKIQFSFRRLWLAGVWGLMLLSLTSCLLHEMRVTSSISPAPLVGQIVNYHVEVSSLDALLPNTTLTITLPAGVELVQGELFWHGDLAKNQVLIKDLSIRVTRPGEYVITAYADTDMGFGKSNRYVSETQALYITSSADSAQVVDALKKTPTPCGSDLDCGAPPPAVTPHKP